MDKEQLMNIRHSALTELEGTLQEALIAAKLNTYEDGEIEVLNVIFPVLGIDGEGVAAELLFLPILSEEALVQYFATVVTIAEEIEQEHFHKLYEAISFINYRIPCGCFILEEETGTLLYKLSVPLPIELEGDALLREMNIISGNAVAYTDQYMDLLLGMLDGDIDMETIRDAFAKN